MKKMKKSMFITTLMMVVLLIVAISTSTFAWFSANDTVSATQTTMTAATSSAANIAIGWAEADAYMGSTISFANGTDLAPATPTYQPTVGGYTTAAQYVSTKELVNGSIPFAYGGEEEVAYANVIYVDTANTVIADDAVITNYPGLLGTPTILSRIYRTQYAAPEHYRMTSSTITAGLIQYEGYNYRQIVADGAVINPNDISETDANALTLWAEPFNGNNEDASAIIGQRIYNIAEVEDIHVFVGVGEAAPEGFLAGGIRELINSVAGPDFVTVVITLETVDQQVGEEYYINVVDAQSAPFLCPAAVAGDKLYNVRAAGVEKVRTTYTEFAGNKLWTNSIDQQGKFRGAGLETTMITLNNGLLEEEFSDTFYIKNNNALGSPAAKISMKTTFDGQAATLIRFAIFVKNEGETNFSYVSTLSASEDARTYYGSIIKGSLSIDLPYYVTDPLNAKDLPAFIQIDPKKSAAIKVVAWYDGVALGTNESGRAANFVFEFSAT